jgi:hypothetical protein
MECPHCGLYFKKPGNYSESGRGHRAPLVRSFANLRIEGEMTTAMLLVKYPKASKRQVTNAAQAMIKAGNWELVNRGRYKMKPKVKKNATDKSIHNEQAGTRREVARAQDGRNSH